MMEKIRNNKSAACMLVSAVLMAALLVLQFTPFWQYGEAGESCSIGSYVWFPGDHKELDSWLGGRLENHDLNAFVGMPILVLVLSAAGAVLCLIKPETGVLSLLPVACGAAGVIAYLSSGALKLGMGWTWHLLICIALLAFGLCSMVSWIRGLKD